MVDGELGHGVGHVVVLLDVGNRRRVPALDARVIVKHYVLILLRLQVAGRLESTTFLGFLTGPFAAQVELSSHGASLLLLLLLLKAVPLGLVHRHLEDDLLEALDLRGELALLSLHLGDLVGHVLHAPVQRVDLLQCHLERLAQ